ncbi:hypothetical protein B0H14DRAFT_1188940 [Mycena olivaceomarginata]|nr:hypothetical protein B0H14DRAFT_1188940 [Mycena olivaceomarginata]
MRTRRADFSTTWRVLNQGWGAAKSDEARRAHCKLVSFVAPALFFPLVRRCFCALAHERAGCYWLPPGLLLLLLHFTGEAVKGGDAFDRPIESPLRRPAVAWCIRLPRESKYASAGRSRAPHAGSVHARSGHLAAATVASLFPLRDEDEMVDASCAGTLSVTDLLRVVLLISMWR